GWWQGEDIHTRRALGLGVPNEEEERVKDRHRLWRALTGAGVAADPQPPADQSATVVDGALAYVAATPSSLMFAPLDDLLGVPEQPNLPGTIDEHPNWRRRLAPNARDLFEAPEVRARVAAIKGHRP